MNPYEQLVEAFNRLHDETGTEVLSINFSRSGTPIDWDDDTRKWITLGGTE